MTCLTKDWDFCELFLPQVLRGVGLMMCMIPINNLALGTLPPERLKNASGLFNLTRNLGGAVGLAAHQHRPQRPHGPASRAPARGGHLGAAAGAGDAQQHGAALLLLRQRLHQGTQLVSSLPDDVCWTLAAEAIRSAALRLGSTRGSSRLA